MKLVTTLPSSRRWSRINVPLASFAGGLALATAAIIGGVELLGNGTNAQPTSPQVNAALPVIGVVMQEPDFGSVPADSTAFQQSVTASRIPSVVMDEPDFGSVAADSSAFELSADDDLMVVDSHFGTGVGSISAIEGDGLQ